MVVTCPPVRPDSGLCIHTPSVTENSIPWVKYKYKYKHKHKYDYSVLCGYSYPVCHGELHTLIQFSMHLTFDAPHNVRLTYQTIPNLTFDAPSHSHSHTKLDLNLNPIGAR